MNRIVKEMELNHKPVNVMGQLAHDFAQGSCRKDQNRELNDKGDN